ncbi:MAG TPA: hypothetical protein PKG52_07750 [bacterium]|nr:hypothetical protein [bacterium]HPS28904.1 hypothetical protein [bacterium]
MSTIDFIGVETKKNISEIQALAVTIMNAPASAEADIKGLYEAALEQPTVVVTDLSVPKASEMGIPDAKVLVNLTGEDVQTASWAVRIVPSISESLTNPGLADERGELIGIARQASYELIQRETLVHSVYLTENTEFNCKIDICAPVQFAKLVLDTAIHYYPIDEKSSKIYSKTKKMSASAIRIVCYPDWVNEEWLYWKSRETEESSEEPPRIMMIYDIEANTAFLLGAKNFSEIRKAIKILGWNSAVNNVEALPVNGVAKSIGITKGGKKTETTFLTISNSCQDRSYFGLNVHANEFKTKNEEVFISGDSGLLMMTSVQGRKKSLISFGKNYFGSIQSAIVRSSAAPVALSAENVAVSKNEKGIKNPVMNAAFSPNGKLHVPFIQDEKDLSLPEYLVMIVKDELLPPVVLIKDAELISSSWFTYSTECDCCSDMNIIPGGNQNAVWDLATELSVFDKALKKTKFKMIVLNVGPFFGTTGEPVEITDDILLSTYVKIAKGEMKWREWKLMPGYFIPEKNIYKNVKKDFDTVYDPSKNSDMEQYVDLMRDSVEMKIDYLRSISAPAQFIAPFYKILSKLA